MDIADHIITRNHHNFVPIKDNSYVKLFDVKNGLAMKNEIKWMWHIAKNNNNYNVQLEEEDIEDNCDQSDKDRESKVLAKQNLDPSMKFAGLKHFTRKDNLSAHCCGGQSKVSCDKCRVEQQSSRHGHNADVKFDCDQCDKQFSNRDSLTRHIQSVHFNVKFDCDQCDKQFSFRKSLIRHIQSEHLGVKFDCVQCGKEFTEKSKLRRHIQSVHEGTKFYCDKCDKPFSTRSILVRHIQSVHSGIKHNCDQCEKQFTQRKSLKQHIERVHEGIKYGCTQCNKQFKRKRNLRHHIKSAMKVLNMFVP